jgi:hypothetical protein
MIELVAVVVPSIVRCGPKSPAAGGVVKNDFILADLIAMPGDQMRMMLILGKAATPGDAAPAAKLPETQYRLSLAFQTLGHTNRDGQWLEWRSQSTH